ncbi:MAG: hypothetical protein JNL18_05370 [Planctomycetaceae bacterium]|uniref:Uncharacterized protein n=1 Tax=Lacipirellula limnantheis TaxID=2528024 RepID=A0A517U4E7_9BACT|nr:hypothetical protein [Lacipirellula limnantheis]MBL9162158.1 hypothetical protein [Planctomycetaceae bacterium]QDT75519.1 hypothetical protein I41_47300 [Lacipirellula limnantheis]
MSTSRLLNVLILLLATAAGCGGKPSVSGPQNAEEFKSLTTLYYAIARNGERPKDAADFKQRIQGPLAPMAEKLKVIDAEGLFTSKRDGKPLVIVYGAPPASAGPQEVVIHEQDGVDGKRLVGFATGNVEEVDQARFDQLTPKK